MLDRPGSFCENELSGMSAVMGPVGSAPAELESASWTGDTSPGIGNAVRLIPPPGAAPSNLMLSAWSSGETAA
ncbi:MAG: hypothetical protein DMD96_21295 [Candidatus Rokuibacteriota bacterium]|nr:MAG: hypothetical protein DMD96_21295 [Candidatus Rokubacteria bacterium]